MRDRVTGAPAAPRILALDAAGGACSAAVWCDGAVSGRRFELMRRGQSERLMPMVEAAMRDSGTSYSELDLIATTRGPGGFTGVRIGLATARGLALASRKPLFAVSNFEVVAAATSVEERAGRTLAVLLDAKRDDFYLQCFDSELKALDEPRACLPEDLPRALPHPRSPLSGLLLAGDAVEQGLPGLEGFGAVAVADEARQADARVLARLAASAGEGAFGMGRAERAQPLYLRAPDVTQPRART